MGGRDKDLLDGLGRRCRRPRRQLSNISCCCFISLLWLLLPLRYLLEQGPHPNLQMISLLGFCLIENKRQQVEAIR